MLTFGIHKIFIHAACMQGFVPIYCRQYSLLHAGVIGSLFINWLKDISLQFTTLPIRKVVLNLEVATPLGQTDHLKII